MKKPTRFLLPAALATVVTLAALTGVAHADPDQDLARDAVRTGQVLPLEKILGKVKKVCPGDVLEIELKQKGDFWLYDVKVLQPDGQLRKLRVNARTGDILPRRPFGRGDGHGHGHGSGPWGGPYPDDH